jgi:Family of unknown function (DUF6049)
MFRRAHRRTSSASLLAMSLLAITVLPASLMRAATASTVVTDAPSGAPAAVGAQALTVSLAAVTPTVAIPRTPIKITGSVRNSSGVSIAAPVARALIRQSPLSTRRDVSDWASATVEPAMDEVAHASLGKSLGPGSVAVFTLTIPANAITHGEAFAILPLKVEVTGTTSTGAERSGGVHTFLPTLRTVKEFVPLSIAWLVPLTLDPDPALHGSASRARTAAWTRAIGPGSRLDRVIQGTENMKVTWAIDPAILGPQETPLAVSGSATPSPSPSPTPTTSQPPSGSAATPDPVTAQTTALAARLRAAAPGHTLWALPYADPDLAALLALPSGNDLLNKAISHPSTLDVAVGPARSDIAWPVTGTLTPTSQTQLRRAFASPGLAGAVTSASTLSSKNGDTSDASRRASSGLPLLAYDESLSRTVAQTSSKATGAITIQRFLADSMALLGEKPGTAHRAVLVAEPRTFDGDPTVLQSLFTAVAKAPWLTPATTGELLSVSTKLTPEATGSGTSGTPTSPPSPTAQPPAPDPLKPGTSPITSDQLAAIPGTLSDIGGIASILGNGQLFTDTWTDAQVQKLSARWRDHPGGLAAIDTSTNAAIDYVSRNVKVAPSEVNFFADRGVMQVTVVNELPVPIHDVHLTLTPAQPRLRIERQPPALKIGAKSRANIKLQVKSIAAGLVNVDAVLTTPNGTALGEDALVTVRVQPPATWIYWVLGGLAGIVLVLGTQRSLRRGSTRASRPDGQEPPLND